MTEFEISDVVVSLIQIDDIEAFSYFTIRGQGDLSWNASSEKTGYGFNVVREAAIKDKNGNWSVDNRSYYFTIAEMKDNFIKVEYFDDRQIKRDIKINKIINE